MPETTTVTIPAYSEVLDEKLSITVPTKWAARVEAIAATGHTVYGPKFSRPVVETLRDISYKTRGGYEDLIDEDLTYCEQKVGLAGSVRTIGDGSEQVD